MIIHLNLWLDTDVGGIKIKKEKKKKRKAEKGKRERRKEKGGIYSLSLHFLIIQLLSGRFQTIATCLSLVSCLP
jgi:hypothetical protein